MKWASAGGTSANMSPPTYLHRSVRLPRLPLTSHRSPHDRSRHSSYFMCDATHSSAIKVLIVVVFAPSQPHAVVVKQRAAVLIRGVALVAR